MESTWWGTFKGNVFRTCKGRTAQREGHELTSVLVCNGPVYSLIYKKLKLD